MSLKTRALVFSTFFGSCIAIGLLLVSLTTNYWVQASPKRNNTSESFGYVNFGLFFGNRDLNVGYGDRNQAVNVYTFITSEEDIMSFWLWLVTALGTGFGLLSCAIAAIASVIKAASASKKRGTMVLLFVSNISSASSQIIAFICWVIQFYQYLTHNVLPKEKQKDKWYSKGTASFGFSFYMLVLAILVVFMNVVILIYAKRREHREDHRFEPPSEEKNQSAIMLY